MPLMFSRFCSCHYPIVNDWCPWIPRSLFQLWLSDGHSTNPRNANRAVLSYVTMRSGPEFIIYHPFNHISTQIFPQNQFFPIYFLTLRNLFTPRLGPKLLRVCLTGSAEYKVCFCSRGDEVFKMYSLSSITLSTITQTLEHSDSSFFSAN